MKINYIMALITMLLLCAGTVSCKRIDIFQYHTSMYDDIEKLSSNKSSYSYVSKEGVADEKNAKIDFSFSGCDILWEIVADEETKINCSYNVEILEGKFKVILVSEKGKIVTILENTNEDANEGILSLDIPQGENMIKIVGNKAVGSLEINLNYEDNISVKSLSFKE